MPSDSSSDGVSGNEFQTLLHEMGCYTNTSPQPMRLLCIRTKCFLFFVSESHVDLYLIIWQNSGCIEWQADYAGWAELDIYGHNWYYSVERATSR